MEEVDLLIEHGHLVTVDEDDRQISDGLIAVRGGRIVALGACRDDRWRFRAPRVVNAAGKYVFPGFVNTHTHLFQVLLKGLGRDKPLIGWLQDHIRPVIPKLDEESCYLAAAAGCIEAIRSGTTTVLDYMYAHPRPGLSDAVISAFLDTGVRGILARGFTDRAYGDETQRRLVEDVEDVLADAARLNDRYGDGDRVDVWLAPTAIWNLTERGLDETARFSRRHGVPVTMHLKETESDDESSLSRFGQRALPYLASRGFLDEKVLAVHCVHLDDQDVRILSEHGVKVSYNPASNMIMGSGIPPITRLLQAGVTVGLATDGAASNDGQDMVETLKLAALLQKVGTGNPAVISATRVLRMATIDGARALGKEREIGSLEVGKAADLFIYDPLKAKSAPVHDPVASLVFSSGESNIDTTVVGGRVIMEHGRIPGLDEEGLLRRLSDIAGRLIN